jgi:hypothetical protein
LETRSCDEEDLEVRRLQMNSTTDGLDICKDVVGQSLEWIETVPYHLKTAKEHMEGVAAEKPGHYFVFDPQHHRIVAEIDATRNRASS